jgi:hypothetical protein
VVEKEVVTASVAMRRVASSRYLRSTEKKSYIGIWCLESIKLIMKAETLDLLPNPVAFMCQHSM